ncbi:MAG TPA: CDP-alcohol phosphatidyltransferase family protein [Thermoanaerobaculia bacterium]|nr:CDP-alcohol phosphatidyltransferase family protein [Thermoanaerobaculia bacterium]
MNIPNALTLLRLLLVPCFIGASIERMYGVAFVIFTTAAITDVLDGMIARRLNQRTRFGALFDPAADKLLMVSGYVFYTFSTTLPVVAIPGWLTFVVFIRDFLLAVFAYLLYTRVHIQRFPPTWAGKASTVLQAVTLGAAIAANAGAPGLLRLAELLFQAALVMTLYSSFAYLRRAERWLDEEAAAGA